MRSLAAGLGAVALSAMLAGSACAQGSALERQVAAVSDGRVEFNFPSRADACGDGAQWYRVGTDSWYGRTTDGFSVSSSRMACENGPVRVMVTLVAREIVRIESFVGPLVHQEGATDLGAVDAREATAWLLGLARRLNGRPSRDAIGPTVLARDGASADGLAAIARDEDRSRETRRSSVNALLRLESAAGIPTLVRLSESGNDAWLASEAVRVLGRSGDPRARAHLRTVVADTKRPEATRISAVSGLGGELATGADAALLRDSFAGMESDRAREAVLTALASIGGRTNATWLIGVAKDERLSQQVRRRAVSLVERAGVSGAELGALYDAVTDTETRGAVISALANEGSRPSREKLAAIAKSTETPAIRRRAISALERFDSPETRELLTTLAMPRP